MGSSWFGESPKQMRMQLNGLQTKMVLLRERAQRNGYEMVAAGLEDTETALRKCFKYLDTDLEEHS